MLNLEFKYMEKGASTTLTLLIANKNHSHLDLVRVNPDLYAWTVLAACTVVETLR